MDQTNYADSIINLKLINQMTKDGLSKHKKMIAVTENYFRRLTVEKISGNMGDC